MSARILRYEVPVDGRWHAITSRPPLAVGCRDRDIVEFWAWEIDGVDPDTREYSVYGTGQRINDDVVYVGTAPAPGKTFIWHLVRRLP